MRTAPLKGPDGTPVAAPDWAAPKRADRVTLTIPVEVITPILGGGCELRELDDDDVIRGATVRGHLRFWWRALYAHDPPQPPPAPQTVFGRESELWGRAATDGKSESAVDLRIEVLEAGESDANDIHLQQTPGAYALWPARAVPNQNKPPAPRRTGTRFQLTLVVPKHGEAEVRDAVRAWILFGGYGSRTRRGLGSLTAHGDAAEDWLPASATRAELTGLFGRDVLGARGSPADAVPRLGGASLLVGAAVDDRILAWTTALGWLRDFRQGTGGPAGGRAREPGAGKPQPYRPSISNWPEADKVRRLSTPAPGRDWAHAPRHDATPAWPRAGFGLPIALR